MRADLRGRVRGRVRLGFEGRPAPETRRLTCVREGSSICAWLHTSLPDVRRCADDGGMMHAMVVAEIGVGLTY